MKAMTKLATLFKAWRQRAEFYAYWDTFDFDPMPPVSFSLSWFTYEERPAFWSAAHDTNRWKYLNVRITFSHLVVTIDLPFKRLPDTPVERDENGRIVRRKRVKSEK
jgi:hypothetical protein